MINLNLKLQECQYCQKMLVGRFSREPAQLYTSCGTRASHGLPHILIHFQLAFLKPLFSPVVPAVEPLCKCATHSLLFQSLRSLLPLVFIFPTLCKSSTCTIWLRRDRLSSIFRVIHIRLYSQRWKSLWCLPFWRLFCLCEASSLCPPVLPYLLLPSVPAPPVIPSSLLALCVKLTIF